MGPFAERENWFRTPLEGLQGTVPARLAACAGTTDRLDVEDGQVHVQGWAVTPGLPRFAVGVAAFGPAGRLLGYARTWEPRWDSRQLSGMPVVLGYDFWFPQPEAEAARKVDLVALFRPARRPRAARRSAILRPMRRVGQSRGEGPPGCGSLWTGSTVAGRRTVAS